MTPFEKFRKKMEYSGTAVKDTFTKDARLLLDKEFENDATHKDVYYLWSGKDINELDIEQLEKVSIRVASRKYVDDTYVENFVSPYGYKIEMGTTLYNSEENKFYICTSSINKDSIQFNGKITRCNSHLKWQDEYGNIYDYPIAVKLTGSSEDENNYITLGSTQYECIVKKDDNTLKLQRDKRFYIGELIDNPLVYSTVFNKTTKDGLCTLYVSETTEAHENDRKDLWLCDYIEFNKEEKDDRTIVPVISYKGDSELKIGSSYKTFTANFYDENGEEITESAEWELDIDPEYEAYVDYIVDENTIKIRVYDDDDVDLRNKVLVLTLRDSNKLYQSKLEIVIVNI